MDDVAAVNNARGEYRRLAASLNNNPRSPSQSPPLPSLRLPLLPRSRLLTGGLSDDEAWWIVIEGEHPGAYQGR